MACGVYSHLQAQGAIIAAPMASTLAEYRVAPGRSPQLLLPPNESSGILRS